MSAASRAAAAPWVLALACTLPVTEPPADPVLSAPVNDCSSRPCSAYGQTGVTPACIQVPSGLACTVNDNDPDIVFTVSVPEDAFLAPGQTFAIPVANLFDPTLATAKCQPKACTFLPKTAGVSGVYTAKGDVEQTLGWNLGNGGGITSLPVHATYRPLWPPTGTAASAVDAASIGLPVSPIAATVLAATSPQASPGPNGGPSLFFAVDLPLSSTTQPALYEMTIAPDPPFDAAFPPIVSRVSIGPGTNGSVYALLPDDTTETGALVPQIPTFQLTRSPDGLAGWTAYLADAKTSRPLSPVVQLGPAPVGGAVTVQLPTAHEPQGTDALTDAELVVAPPAGQPFPTLIVQPTGNELPAAEPYPALPKPTSISGVVTDVDGKTPVEADLVFEVVASSVGGIYQSGPPVVLNTTNLSYTGVAHARVDASSGASTYSAVLPAGQYRLTVRPLDTGHAVTVQQTVDVPASAAPVTEKPLAVGPLQQVRGRAVVGDGRSLSGATVVAVPAACASGVTGPADACLPRPGQTTTDDEGSFSLDLDLGSYALRVEPAPGTHLPWVVQNLVVTPEPVSLDSITVNAPVYAGVQLLDPLGNAVANAVVRAYRVPAQGPAVQLGEAVTDATGQYELYLSASSP